MRPLSLAALLAIPGGAAAVHHQAVHRLTRRSTSLAAPSSTSSSLSSSAPLRRPQPRSRHERRRGDRQRGLEEDEEDGAAPESTDPVVEGIGTHYAYAWVGTPPQRQSVILDTGSYKTAFPCEPCSDCSDSEHGDYTQYHESGPFVPSASSTLETFETTSENTWSQSYSEGDGWTAEVVRDVVYLGGETADDPPHAADQAVTFKFGCQTQIGGLFITQEADGIMGMGMKNSFTFVHALLDGGQLERDAFSLCFARGGGSLALGGSMPAEQHAAPMEYAALGAKGSFFGVTWQDLRLVPSSDRGASTGSSIMDYGARSDGFGGSSHTIIDSGTTFTYIPSALRTGFEDLWEEVTGFKYQTEESLDPDVDVDGLPDLLFAFARKDGGGGDQVFVTVKPSAYVDVYCPYDEGHADYGPGDCYNFLSIMFEGHTQILGANFMQDHDVYFDTTVGGRSRE
jgi:hypothetical protein